MRHIQIHFSLFTFHIYDKIVHTAWSLINYVRYAQSSTQSIILNRSGAVKWNPFCWFFFFFFQFVHRHVMRIIMSAGGAEPAAVCMWLYANTLHSPIIIIIYYWDIIAIKWPAKIQSTNVITGGHALNVLFYIIIYLLIQSLVITYKCETRKTTKWNTEFSLNDHTRATFYSHQFNMSCGFIGDFFVDEQQ